MKEKRLVGMKSETVQMRTPKRLLPADVGQQVDEKCMRRLIGTKKSLSNKGSYILVNQMKCVTI